MKIGYARVSTGDQDPELQLAALKKAGCKELFTDRGFSGAALKRPALARCLKRLEHGDTLTVWKLDRLARSVRDLLNIMHDLQARGVEFQSLTEEINTRTPAGRMMFQILAVLAEFERGLILERTREGLKAAKARGVKLGPKFKIDAGQIDAARSLMRSGHTIKDIAKTMKVHRTTLARALAWREAEEAKAG